MCEEADVDRERLLIFMGQSSLEGTSGCMLTEFNVAQSSFIVLSLKTVIAVEAGERNRWRK